MYMKEAICSVAAYTAPCHVHCTCGCSVKNDFAFLWKLAIFRYSSNRKPLNYRREIMHNQVSEWMRSSDQPIWLKVICWKEAPQTGEKLAY